MRVDKIYNALQEYQDEETNHLVHVQRLPKHGHVQKEKGARTTRP